MTIARHLLVDPNVTLFYHLTSRCIRRAFLCGFDSVTGIDYSHRKGWLEQRMLHLTSAFAVELWAYAVMDNHFHQVVRYFPRACEAWSDEEVAARWFHAFPLSRGRKPADEEALARAKSQLLDQPDELARRRERLGSLSAFMQALKQPIARRANLEDQCTGRFFEQRFYSGALLDESAVIASMAYVDLNPVRANLVEQVSQYDYTSFAHRLNVVNNTKERLQQAIAPIVSGVDPEDQLIAIPNALLPFKKHPPDMGSKEDGSDPEQPDTYENITDQQEGDPLESPGSPSNGGDPGVPEGNEPPDAAPLALRSSRSHQGPIGLGEQGFRELVYSLALAWRHRATIRPNERIARWQTRMASLGQRHRAYGTEIVLKQWSDTRGFRCPRLAWPG